MIRMGRDKDSIDSNMVRIDEIEDLKREYTRYSSSSDYFSEI